MESLSVRNVQLDKLESKGAAMLEGRGRAKLRTTGGERCETVGGSCCPCGLAPCTQWPRPIEEVA